MTLRTQVSRLGIQKHQSLNSVLLTAQPRHFHFKCPIVSTAFKAIIHFQNRKKWKKHRFTNNTGFTEGNGERLLLKYYSIRCFTFREHIKTIENYGLILNTCHDTAKHEETRVGFPIIFSQLRWPIEPKFSRVCYFIYKLWYTKCGQYCLPKVSNGFWTSHPKKG